MPNVFSFILEEQSAGASKAVKACEPGLGDLSKLTALAYVQLLKFVILKNFWLCSNPNFGRLDLVM